MAGGALLHDTLHESMTMLNHFFLILGNMRIEGRQIRAVNTKGRMKKAEFVNLVVRRLDTIAATMCNSSEVNATVCLGGPIGSSIHQ